jgi:hypothetical protein
MRTVPKTRKSRLSHFEQLVLASVASIGKGAYAVRVQGEAMQLLNDDVPFGAVCVTLHRLENKRYLVSDSASPKPEQGGRATRVYKLTAAGHVALRLSVEISERVVAAVARSKVKHSYQ